MANFDDMKLAVEALSGGKNTVLFDDMGMPSIVFPFAKQKYSDLMAGGTQELSLVSALRTRKRTLSISVNS